MASHFTYTNPILQANSYLKNMTEDSYELKGSHIAKYYTGLTIRDLGKDGFAVVVGNPFALLGL